VSAITDVPGILVGQIEDARALTGCTVVLAPAGAEAGVDVRGSAPGTRESFLLSPVALIQQVHAICLCGGSTFGLDAACGVVDVLEERAIGFTVGRWCVPIVPAAVIFDLGIGDGSVRPDRAMGAAAARAAAPGVVAEGNVGAGCGATIGKLGGIGRAMKGGTGTSAMVADDGLIVGAIAIVNALGSIYDLDGARLAGPRADDGSLLDDRMLLAQRDVPDVAGENTVLAVVATNARLTKNDATKVAQMAHDGLARVVCPAHLMGDGDAIFALGTGDVVANVDRVGVMAGDTVAEAIVRGVRAARRAGGLPAVADRAI
jgi:L-aminopeptidase/D-esterase-like protein